MNLIKKVSVRFVANDQVQQVMKPLVWEIYEYCQIIDIPRVLTTGVCRGGLLKWPDLPHLDDRVVSLALDPRQTDRIGSE
jgi:hypothetical protein